MRPRVLSSYRHHSSSTCTLYSFRYPIYTCAKRAIRDLHVNFTHTHHDGRACAHIQRRNPIAALTFTQAILDFSRELDVGLMDRVTTAFYSGAGQEVRRVFVWYGSLCSRVGRSNKWPSSSLRASKRTQTRGNAYHKSSKARPTRRPRSVRVDVRSLGANGICCLSTWRCRSWTSSSARGGRLFLQTRD